VKAHRAHFLALEQTIRHQGVALCGAANTLSFEQACWERQKTKGKETVVLHLLQVQPTRPEGLPFVLGFHQIK
jgi:hypothetical protein